jgi:hypothetical protein
MALSDRFESIEMRSQSPPLWKTQLRESLERLFDLYPKQPDDVKRSIQFAFASFRYEELVKHVDEWSEPHLNAYGMVVRIAEPGIVDALKRDTHSQSAVKRCRAIQAIRFVGMEGGLETVVLEATRDKNEKVRVEAIHTLTAKLKRNEAFSAILPLIQDESNSVKLVAQTSLSSLEGALQYGN